MIEEVKFSADFQHAFKKMKKRYRSLPEDLKVDQIIVQLDNES